ncbi:MAG: type II secretion system GspH family protein [Candidatus Pacebacteria bacterium]|nr:type II secretion system GspH family protein [Candidatus Paceibacterota bacterium]
MCLSHHQKGFTLVELLVVCGIFSAVVVVIAGIFVSLIQIQRDIILTKKALREINYALEFMSRALRTAKKELDKTEPCIPYGYNYYQASNDQIKFINRNENNECQEFYLQNGQIKFKRPDKPALSLTSPTVKISQLTFFLQGQSQDDNRQPLVTIVLAAEIGNKKLHFQTSVSQRDLDRKY